MILEIDFVCFSRTHGDRPNILTHSTVTFVCVVVFLVNPDIFEVSPTFYEEKAYVVNDTRNLTILTRPGIDPTLPYPPRCFIGASVAQWLCTGLLVNN